MINYQKNCLLKMSVAITILTSLVACGGSNQNPVVDLNASATEQSTPSQFPIYSADNNFQVVTPPELTTEQKARANAEFQAFEQQSQSIANVTGFIVKYKNANSALLKASPLSSLSIVRSKKSNETLPTSFGTHTKVATMVNSLGKVTTKHNVDLSFKSENFAGAAVLNTNKALTLSNAIKIAQEMKAADSQIEYAEPNILMTASSLPTSNETSSLWGIKTASTYGINAEKAWSLADGSNVVVAVIDTGYRPHTDLEGRYVMNGTTVAGYDFIDDTTTAADGDGRDNNPIDPGDFCNTNSKSSWHGTHVSGTIAAASNGSGIVGVAYGAKILPVRVLGKCGGYLNDITDAIVWAAGASVEGVPNNTNPAKVINLSLGGGSSTCSTTMTNAIDTARSLGAVVVVAAGNSGAEAQYTTPANCPAAITVGATDSRGLLAYFSNYGPLVDISAPGVSIKSTINAGTSVPGADSAFDHYSGTSMAAPHVAGVLALMFAKNPTLTPSLAESKLVLNSRVFSPNFYILKRAGSGIVDAYKVITALSETTPEPEPKRVVAKARDFNGDSIGDALWRNLNTGITKMTFLTASTITSKNLTHSLLNGTTYALQASGDFNGDGKKDLILRHSINGKAVIALMDGPNVISQGTISTIPFSYKAVASGDFNKDDREDILWRDANGLMFISYMNGVKEISRSASINISPSIKLHGVADFDGDGMTDLVLRAPNGMIYTLIMTMRAGYWIPLASASSDYKIIGIGDYTGFGLNGI